MKIEEEWMNMYGVRKFRLIVFDVDGTLASSDETMSCSASAVLKVLENLGVRIALSSGKDLPYIEGMALEIGIKRPVIIAENGCVIVDVADNKEMWLTERPPEIDEIRARIRGKFPNAIWEQPNRVEFTFSPRIPALRSEVISYAKEVISHYKDKVHAYMYAGCVDILPAGIDKGVGLAEVKKIYGFRKEEVAAVGNGENDIPMFREAGLPLIVGTQITYPTAVRFNTIREVLDFLNRHMKEYSTPLRSPSS